MGQSDGSSVPKCPDCGNSPCRDVGPLTPTTQFAGQQVGLQLSAGSLYACGHCRLKFRYPRVDEHEYLALYEDVTVNHWAGHARPDFALVLDHVRDHVPKGRRVLDVGCHTGTLLEMLGLDYERYGLEPNKTAGKIAISRGVRAVWGDFSELPQGLLFDAIVTCDVIEHVVAPSAFIERLLSRLAPGGVLIVTTGDSDSVFARVMGPRWWYCFYAEHISFVSASWLEAFAATHSVDVLRLEPFCHDRAKGVQWIKQATMCVANALVPSVVGSLLKGLGSRAFVDWPVGDGVAKDHFFAVMQPRTASS
jgi:2-polyprenyl-3-methyl-5-hydroxy-6-metoxy-1,4-benzoquinol methylase